VCLLTPPHSVTWHARGVIFDTPSGGAVHPPATGSGAWDGKIRGTVTSDGDGWVAYMRLEDPPGLSPITTVGRYDTVEEAQVATDDVWAAR
jgi:hypothetical protein